MAIEPDLLNSSPELLHTPVHAYNEQSLDNDTFVLPPELLSDSLLLSEMESEESESIDSTESDEPRTIQKPQQILPESPLNIGPLEYALPIDHVNKKTYHQKVKEEISAYLKSRENKAYHRETGKPVLSRPPVKKYYAKPASIIKSKKLPETDNSEPRRIDPFFTIKKVKNVKPQNFSLDNFRFKKTKPDENRPVKISKNVIHEKKIQIKQKSTTRPHFTINSPIVKKSPIETHKNIFEKKISKTFLQKPRPAVSIPMYDDDSRLYKINKPKNICVTKNNNGNSASGRSSVRSHNDKAKQYPVKSKLPDFNQSTKKTKIFEKEQITTESTRINKKTESLMQMDMVEKRSSTTNRNFSLCQKILPQQLT